MTETSAAVMTEQVIDRFGGIRPMAAKLETPVTTVQGWKKRGVIPAGRHADILAAASRAGIALTPAELAQTDTTTAPLRADSPTAMSEPSAPPIMIIRRSRLAVLALTVSIAALLAVGGGGFAVWYYYMRPLEARVAALESQVSSADGDLSRRIDRLNADLAQRSAAAPSSEPATGDDRVAALEKQLADLKAGSAEAAQLGKHLADLQIASSGRELLAQSIRDIQSSTAATQGEVERLNARFGQVDYRLNQVDAVLAERRQQTLKAEAVVLSVGQLRNALRDSKSFARELASLRGLTTGDAEITAVIDQLQPLADDGVPTIDQLRVDFNRLAPQIVRSAVVGDGTRWWRQALYRIESVISIRRVGADVPGDTADAIVARADAKMDDDDVAGAVAALQALTGLSADIANPWIHDAEKRIAADAAETELTRLAIDRVAAGDAKSAPTAHAAPEPAPRESGPPEPTP